MSAIRAMLAALIAAAAVSACTTATPYQPYRPEAAGGVHGGYSDQQLAPDRYLVRFHGNELTSRDRVEGYMLYRVAELTLQRGYDWFLIVDRNTEHDTQTYAAPDPLYRPYYGSGYGYWRPYWRYYRPGFGWGAWDPWRSDPFWTDRFDLRTVESFEAQAEIMLRRGAAPTSEPRAFDARKIVTELGPTIQRPKT
jgi:hypothetical protein